MVVLTLSNTKYKYLIDRNIMLINKVTEVILCDHDFHFEKLYSLIVFKIRSNITANRGCVVVERKFSTYSESFGIFLNFGFGYFPC